MTSMIRSGTPDSTAIRVSACHLLRHAPGRVMPALRAMDVGDGPRKPLAYWLLLDAALEQMDGNALEGLKLTPIVEQAPLDVAANVVLRTVAANASARDPVDARELADALISRAMAAEEDASLEAVVKACMALLIRIDADSCIPAFAHLTSEATRCRIHAVRGGVDPAAAFGCEASIVLACCLAFDADEYVLDACLTGDRLSALARHSLHLACYAGSRSLAAAAVLLQAVIMPHALEGHSSLAVAAAWDALYLHAGRTGPGGETIDVEGTAGSLSSLLLENGQLIDIQVQTALGIGRLLLSAPNGDSHAQFNLDPALAACLLRYTREPAAGDAAGEEAVMRVLSQLFREFNSGPRPRSDDLANAVVHLMCSALDGRDLAVLPETAPQPRIVPGERSNRDLNAERAIRRAVAFAGRRDPAVLHAAAESICLNANELGLAAARIAPPDVAAWLGGE